MKSLVLVIIGLLFIMSSSAFPQEEKVKSYLRLVAEGKIDEVKKQVPDMIAEYPDDPGVRFLLAVVLDDANRAMDIYKKIVKDYPTSTWAENSYWRIIQFYAITGDIDEAQKQLQNFRKQFPGSEFLLPATDVVSTAVSIEKAESKGKFYKDNAQPSVASTTREPAAQPSKEKPAVKPAEKEPEVKTTKPATPKLQTETPKAKKPETTIEEDNGNSLWGLQVGVFKTKDAAEKEKGRLLNKRMRTNVIEKEVDDEKMFSVVVGNYSSRIAAEEARQIVAKECDCTPLVVKK